MNKKTDFRSIENISANVETHGEPFLKPHFEPNVKASAPTFDKTQSETTEMQWTFIKEHEVQDKSNGEAEEDDDQPFYWRNFPRTLPKELKIQLKISLRDEDKGKHKDVISNFTLRDADKERKVTSTKSPLKKENKSLRQKTVSKKRKVESTSIEKKPIKRQLLQISESETNDEDDVLDIVTTSRRNIGEKKIPINISFHYVANIQK
ncbi:unnamed protein product [Vicia faba]|uniref:Uncharacterized protein n=1 Tax=Vicia faba TaxID=3906 RepID=A0AAV0YJ71_VICFA|nr:unnamed protein product [Vicia faba]